MATEDIKKLLEKRAKLREELHKIDSFLDLYRELIGTEPVPSETNVSAKRVEKVAEHYRRRSGTVKPSDLGPMVRRILLDHGKPMTRSELVKALEDRDVPLGGADKSKYLGTILWRAREAFTNIEGQGYWPSDVPWEGKGQGLHPGKSTTFLVDADGSLRPPPAEEPGS